MEQRNLTTAHGLIGSIGYGWAPFYASKLSMLLIFLIKCVPPECRSDNALGRGDNESDWERREN